MWSLPPLAIASNALWPKALAGALLIALATGLLSGPILRRLPEPELDPGEHKQPYAELATRRFATAVALAGFAAAGIVVVRLPAPLWPAWTGLVTVGALLAVIDARTTWLPLRLTHWLWALTAVGAAVTVLLTGWPIAVQMAVGATVASVVFGGFWYFTGGIGFGDVRLAPVLGLLGAAVSWQTLAGALIAGTLLGALVGVIRLILRRPGPFPYGPPLIAGLILATALLA